MIAVPQGMNFVRGAGHYLYMEHATPVEQQKQSL
jgi:hypothetical protein